MDADQGARDGKAGAGQDPENPEAGFNQALIRGKIRRAEKGIMSGGHPRAYQSL